VNDARGQATSATPLEAAPGATDLESGGVSEGEEEIAPVTGAASAPAAKPAPTK